MIDLVVSTRISSIRDLALSKIYINLILIVIGNVKSTRVTNPLYTTISLYDSNDIGLLAMYVIRKPSQLLSIKVLLGPLNSRRGEIYSVGDLDVRPTKRLAYSRHTLVLWCL